MNLETNTASDISAPFRNALIDNLINREWMHRGPVEAAMRVVPRHVFVPEVQMETAYLNKVVVTKRDAKGKAISSASEPWIVGLMLEQLDIQPGHRVLEIGAGTGYNAALLAHLVGETGQVTTVDFDQDVADRARSALTQAGYDRVNVICGDGELGFSAGAPYDRIIVTVGAADLPPAWFEQLIEGGRLVVPLRIRGSQRVFAFERTQDHWRSIFIVFGGFMAMRGIGAQETPIVPLHQGVYDDEVTCVDVTLQVDENQSVDREALADALMSPRYELKTGVGLSHVGTSKEESTEWLQLWLAFSFPGYAHLGGKEEAIKNGLLDLPYRFHYSPAIFDRDTFAYFALRPTEELREGHEFVICAHGPNATELAHRVSEQIQIWNRDYRTARPCIEARYRDSPRQSRDRLMVEKKHVELTISWA